MRRELKQAFKRNSDGAGFMYNTPDGTVQICKGWFGFRKFYKGFRHAEQQFTDSTFVLHMRIATSGKLDQANCHPFSISPQAGFAHNGVLVGLGDKTRSDTKEFVEDTLQKLPCEFWDNPEIFQALDTCATATGSKFVLLLGSGKCIVMNEKLGSWNEGCWYSNDSYKVFTPITTFVQKHDTKTETRHRPSPHINVYSHERCSICGLYIPDEGIGFSDGKRTTICAACETSILRSECRCVECWQPYTITDDLMRDLTLDRAICSRCGSIIDAEDMALMVVSDRFIERGNI